MTDQPGFVLEEAAKLFTTLRRRMRATAEPDDVWSQATREPVVHGIATGAPECRYCPICRTIAAARTSGPDVVDHMADAGQALFAAIRDAVAAYERTRPPRRDTYGDQTNVG